MQTYPEFKGRLYGPWDNDPKTGAVAKLSNEGDVIDVKLTGEGDVSCSYSMEPPWPSLANGKGRTLVYKGGNAAQATSWGASKVMNGNPGVGNDEWLTTSNIRLNEIMPTGTGVAAWVELYNAGSADVDVTGWIFESKIRKEKLTIKAGTGANNVALMMNYEGKEYTISQDQTYLVVRGTNLKTTTGASYLWWLNGINRGSQVAPASVNTITLDGIQQQVIAWNMSTSGLYDNFSDLRPSVCMGNTIFGLTSTTGTSTIYDINFATSPSDFLTTTNISNTNTTRQTSNYFYTLQGIRTSTTQKGIYINSKNHKSVIIR